MKTKPAEIGKLSKRWENWLEKAITKALRPEVSRAETEAWCRELLRREMAKDAKKKAEKKFLKAGGPLFAGPEPAFQEEKEGE